MSEFYKGPRLRTVATLAAIGSLGVAGCGSDSNRGPEQSSSAPLAPHSPAVMFCDAQYLDQWKSPIDNFFNASKIAQRLGVSENHVAAGSVGIADCERAITSQELASGGVVVDIKNMGKVCLAVGFRTEPLDTPHKDVITVCPSPNEPTA